MELYLGDKTRYDLWPLYPSCRGGGASRVTGCQSVVMMAVRKAGLVDFRVAEVSASELGLVSELLLDPAGQRSQRSDVSS